MATRRLAKLTIFRPLVMRGPLSPANTKVVATRLPHDEVAALKRRAAALGITPGEYIRQEIVSGRMAMPRGTKRSKPTRPGTVGAYTAPAAISPAQLAELKRRGITPAQFRSMKAKAVRRT